MRANVDPTLCIGCTQCTALCPEVFHMEESIAHAADGPIPDAYEVQAVAAEEGCPVGAISLQS